MNVKSAAEGRAFGLDVCRTIAILLVVWGHTVQHSSPHPLIAEYGMVGLFGVDLFFCLSGFLIGRILLADSTSWPERCEVGLFRFWYRRWMRTLPLYFFYLVVSLKYDWRGETVLSAHVPYLLFAQNLAWPMPEFFHLSWSLAVEEWFYLTFPLIILLFVGLGLSARRAAFSAIVVLIITPMIARYFLPPQMPELRSFDEALRHVVVFRLDGIGFGVLMAYLYTWHPKIFDAFRRYAIFGLVLVVGCVTATKRQYFGYVNSPFLAPFYFTVSAFGFAALLPWFNALRPTGSKVVNGGVKFVSLVSYSLYLGHIPGFMIALWGLHHFGIFDAVYPQPWLLYPIFFVSAFGVATVTYLCIEKPVLKLRDLRGRVFSQPVKLRAQA